MRNCQALNSSPFLIAHKTTPDRIEQNNKTHTEEVASHKDRKRRHLKPSSVLCQVFLCISPREHDAVTCNLALPSNSHYGNQEVKPTEVFHKCLEQRR